MYATISHFGKQDEQAKSPSWTCLLKQEEGSEECVRRDNSNNDAEFANITDTRNEDASGETSRPSDHIILLNTFKEFVRMEKATLEELPGLDSQLSICDLAQSFSSVSKT